MVCYQELVIVRCCDHHAAWSMGGAGLQQVVNAGGKVVAPTTTNPQILKRSETDRILE